MKHVLVVLMFSVIIFFAAPPKKATAEEIKPSSPQGTAYLAQHRLTDLHKLFPPVERRKKVLCVVVDSGVQANHPAFAGHLRKDLARDFVAGRPEIDSGPHGTLVASIMLAASGGTCDIVSLKAVLMLDGKWAAHTTDSVTAAFREINSWSEKQISEYAGVVVNASVYVDSTKDLRELRTEIEKLGTRAVVVGIAGNMGLNPIQYPAYWAWDIRAMSSVGAVDASGKKASFSNYGLRMLNTALGVEVPGAIPDGYGTGSGTSFSAPIVSGEVAALMVLAADKGWTLPPALFARVANIGDYNPNLAGMMADPPTTANGLKAWEALNKLFNLKALRTYLDRGGQIPIASILIQEPLDQFTGLKFTAHIEADGQTTVIRDYCWFVGTTIQFVGPDKSGDYRVTVVAEGQKLFTVLLLAQGARIADDPNPRHGNDQGDGPRNAR